MKRFILAFYFILYVLLGSAQNVTIENANKIADEYIKSSAIFCNSQTENSIRKLASIDRATTKSFSILGEVPMYLVQLEDGWVLVASDSISKPILASSPTGVFPDLEDMPDGMKWLLSQYEIAIKFALDSIQNRTVNPQWNNLSSFINSKTIDTISVNYQTFTLPNSYRLNRIDSVFWNQYGNNDSNGALCEKSYNKFCPDWYTPYCGRTYVGCSSVALGIVLWYHQWPTHAYIYNTIDSTAVVSEETHLVLYNWNDILPKLFNTTPDYNVDAVAGLLRDCGYAGKTKYGEKGSSSNLSKTKNALENTFNFKKNIEHKYKKYYSSQDWENKIKSEIVSGRPVLYRGAEPDGGGHAFVLYGYTGDAFNIHWGWGGNSNAGLYTLDPLDPSPSSNGPYSEGQAALFGVEPDYHCEALELIGILEDDTCFLVQGGSIILSNYVISENQVGYYYSGSSIKLTNGFHAKSGSEMHIAIKDIPCYDTVSAPQRVAPRTSSAPTDNANYTNEEFDNNGLETVASNRIVSTSIYTITGQLIQTIYGGQHDATHLPNGMYILQHRMSDGNVRSEKIANNK